MKIDINPSKKFVPVKSNKKSIFLILSIFVFIATIEIIYMINLRNLIYESMYKNINEFIAIETLSTMVCLVVMLIVVVLSITITVSNQSNSKKIYDIAYVDNITELGNGTYFKGKAPIFLEENSGKNNYVITVDINKFKALNNIYGYEFCNGILKEFGKKIQEKLPKNNLTCRISNDVFASIFSYDEDIKEMLEKIYNEISFIEVENVKEKLNLSIGVYKILPNEKDINKILDKSYLARSQIKGIYNQNYYLFDDVLEKQLLEAQEIERTMQAGLDNGEFIVIYQPKILAQNEKIAGAEALVRWNRNGEIISPSKFIPLFEKNKFIIKLDLYVFERTCKDLAEWKEKFGAIPIVSINVSKEHFIDEDFIDEYVKICNKYNLKPSEIDLEITESATIDEKIDILKILNKIKEKGFIISLDDFGTGYSSLGMLQDMPIDIIKIDKVFVDKANPNSDNNIINNIMIIAKQLGVKTVVEGVETKEQVNFIKKINGDIIQGYYFAKPMPKEDFEEYCKNSLK